MFSKLRPSGDGVGVFALIDIPKDTDPFESPNPLIHEVVDFTEAEVESLPEYIQYLVKAISIPHDGLFPLPADGLNGIGAAWLLNTASSPEGANCNFVDVVGKGFKDIRTTRAVKSGEELLLYYEIPEKKLCTICEENPPDHENLYGCRCKPNRCADCCEKNIRERMTTIHHERTKKVIGYSAHCDICTGEVSHDYLTSIAHKPPKKVEMELRKRQANDEVMRAFAKQRLDASAGASACANAGSSAGASAGECASEGVDVCDGLAYMAEDEKWVKIKIFLNSYKSAEWRNANQKRGGPHRTRGMWRYEYTAFEVKEDGKKKKTTEKDYFSEGDESIKWVRPRASGSGSSKKIYTIRNGPKGGSKGGK